MNGLDVSVTWEKDGAVVRAVIERPRVHNAIDSGVMGRLEGLLEDLRSDRELRVLVVRGAGGAFVSGGDLQEFSRLVEFDEVAEMSGRMKAILRGLEELDCWTVACINGDAYGGGCELAMAFDFRIASERARLGFTQARFAIPPGWGGLTRLVELVGRPVALKWLATAAVVDAPRAKRAGVIDEVVAAKDLDAHLEALSRRLAKLPRELTRVLKDGARRAVELPRDEAMEKELKPFCDLWVAEKHHRRVEEFLSGSRAGDDDNPEQ